MKSTQAYIDEMMKMYRSVPTQTENTPPPTTQPLAPSLPTTDGVGGLLVQVTTLRNLYAVKNAQVTILKDGEVIDKATTDESGRTKVFSLKAPSKNYSESAGSSILPYAIYEVRVSADGYVDNITIDVPVFSTVTSIQPIDLILLSASENDSPQINQGAGEYPL